MTKSESATHTTITTDATIGPKFRSIRNIIMTDIRDGVDKAVTRQTIATFHAGTAADAKFAKHYAWYRGTMKKAGLLPAPVAAE